MKVLALDLATRTGWACGDIRDGPAWGAFALPRTGEALGPYLQAFDDWFDTFLHKARPDLVCYEAPVFMDRSKTQLHIVRKLYSLAGMTEVVCHRHRVDVAEADNQVVKRAFTGHGGKKGGRLILSCRNRGWLTADENEADALAVWFYMVTLLDKEHGTKFALRFDPLFRGQAA